MPIAEKSSTELLDLIGLITGKSGSTSGSKTSTTQSNITAEGMQELINQALAGPGGVAQIANTEKAAGLYGGSTAALLQNDLVARTAAKLAAAKAGTTTTETNKGRTDTDPAINPLKAFGGLAGVSLLNSLLGGSGGIAGASGSIADLIKAGGSGLMDLLKGNGGLTVDPNGMSTNNSGLTQQQMEAGGVTTATNLPAVDDYSDMSALTTIPISSLFSGGTDNYGGFPDNDFGGDGGDSEDDGDGDYGD